MFSSVNCQQLNTSSFPVISLQSLIVLMVVTPQKKTFRFGMTASRLLPPLPVNSRNTLLLSADSYFCLSLEGTAVRQFQVYAQDRCVNSYCAVTFSSTIILFTVLKYLCVCVRYGRVTPELLPVYTRAV